MRVPVLVFATLLTGCAAQGVKYSEHPMATTPVRADQARLVVFRTNRAQGTITPATVELDSIVLPPLLEKGYLVRDLAPGKHRIVAELNVKDYARCALDFDLAAGQTRYFLVSPRPQEALSQVPGALMDLIQFAGQPSMAIPAAVVDEANRALDAAIHVCGGTFAVAELKAATAEPLLQALRESGK